MIEISTANKISEETEPLFSIDGTVYTIRREFPASVSLKMLAILRDKGEAAAVAWAMDTALGRTAVKALEECESLTNSDLKAIVEIVRIKVQGELETEGKG